MKTKYKEALLKPQRSRSPNRNVVDARHEKRPFSMFINSNHESFISNPYSSLEDIGDTKEIDELEGDINLNIAP